MDTNIIVGKYRGYKIHYDGINYYVKIKGRNYVIDLMSM